MQILLLLLLLITGTLGLYSPHYSKCRLRKVTQLTALPIELLHPAYVPQFNGRYPSHPIVHSTTLPVQYTPFEFTYRQKLGQGGSAEVFVVEEKQTRKLKIVKRRYNERHQEPRLLQNYILSKVNPQYFWTRDCGDQPCEENTTQFVSLLVMPFKYSIPMHQVAYDNEQSPLLFKKALQALNCLHSKGIIHRDITSSNVIVTSPSSEFSQFEVELIDWDAAMVYYPNYERKAMGGLKCYQAPQVMMGTKYRSPATDIWALAVVMYLHYTGHTPFALSCAQKPVKVAMSLHGAQPILEVYQKYRLVSVKNHHLLRQASQSPQQYLMLDLSTFKTDLEGQPLNRDLIDVIKSMLQPDAEIRATTEQLLMMPYFSKLSKNAKKF